MLAWKIRGEFGIDRLQCVDLNEPVPREDEVVVEMRAAAANYRDLLTVEGVPGMRAPSALVPFSDGAGVVCAVGAAVRSVRVGDRVASTFYQNWIDGPFTAERRSLALGGTLNGVLQERIALRESGIVRIPNSMSFEAAATLPCAGLTAWRAVVVEAPVGPGDTVLVQGTGGVSIFALQFAKARGAKVIATSSSDAKLERVRRLGADFCINYRTTPSWGKLVREMTDGRGVDVVVEVGGEKTLTEAISCTRIGGRIVLIGMLSGASHAIALPTLFVNNLLLIGVSVGSRAHFVDMLSAIDDWKLQPVIDRIYPFSEVPRALSDMRSGDLFGKLCVRFDRASGESTA